MLWPLRIAVVACVLAVAAGCEPPPPFVPGGAGGSGGPSDAGATGNGGAAAGDAAAVRPGPFTVIVLPDTQFYSSDHPKIFDAQTEWIVENRDLLNIAFVLHEGDIVNDPNMGQQWQNASRSLHRLDGLVPYFLTVGNHDIRTAERDSMLSSFFPVSTFSSLPWFGGTFEPGRIDNNYGIVPVQGGAWLVLALEFGPRAQVLEWADAVLAQHPGIPAMIVTHAYLYFDGTRYDHILRPDQNWNPHGYHLDDTPGGVNDGEEMWKALVSKHDAIRFVLSGHVLPRDPSMDPDVAARLTSMRDSGSDCHQILANYQTCVDGPCSQTNGGNGFLRIMRFDPATHAVTVQTYSPYLDTYKEDPSNQFVLRGD